MEELLDNELVEVVMGLAVMVVPLLLCPLLEEVEEAAEVGREDTGFEIILGVEALLLPSSEVNPSSGSSAISLNSEGPISESSSE